MGKKLILVIMLCVFQMGGKFTIVSHMESAFYRKRSDAFSRAVSIRSGCSRLRTRYREYRSNGTAETLCRALGRNVCL